VIDIFVIDTNARADAGHGISFGKAFRAWLRVALLSFGGRAGQIASHAPHPGRRAWRCGWPD
jgi:chromate transporter